MGDILKIAPRQALSVTPAQYPIVVVLSPGCGDPGSVHPLRLPLVESIPCWGEFWCVKNPSLIFKCVKCYRNFPTSSKG